MLGFAGFAGFSGDGPRVRRTGVTIQRNACRDGPRTPHTGEGRYAGGPGIRGPGAQAETGRCTRIDWSSPMAIQTANIEVPP
ncbi:hypothetical protein SAMN05192584_105235 [Streptomyces pini]|uniref:Uncharacterized protein n=1 Tax=Streptomyces pini TaxID=1520580 RepID=A0A1I3YX59_9ACTN|nr:hypothetical protein SAMN05192584_105235 [Streptomyces pini]